jgi:hypothetical protein
VKSKGAAAAMKDIEIIKPTRLVLRKPIVRIHHPGYHLRFNIRLVLLWEMLVGKKTKDSERTAQAFSRVSDDGQLMFCILVLSWPIPILRVQISFITSSAIVLYQFIMRKYLSLRILYHVLLKMYYVKFKKHFVEPESIRGPTTSSAHRALSMN